MNKFKYLFMTENIEFFKCDEYNDDDIQAVSDGYLTIIRLDTLQYMNFGNDGAIEWVDIDKWEI